MTGFCETVMIYWSL